MSNFRAIAAVTAALKGRLQDAASEAVSGAMVRPGRPEAPASGSAVAPGIDLYLYQVVPNAALRNDDLPTRRGDGSLAQRPRVALDLHYLLTFRGNEAQLEPQILLGNAARALHTAPFVTADLIAQAAVEFGFVDASGLADAVELVKVTPLSLSLEELSKLWSVFFQIPYNLSVAYQATVVVIEGDETPAQALPVLERRLSVIPFQDAFIEEAFPASGRGLPIVAGDTLVLRGRQLRRDPTRVVLHGVEVEPTVLSDTEIRVPLTSPPFPAGALRAGVQGVSVVHPLLLGEPPVEHLGFASNAVALVLRPTIDTISAPDATHVNVTVTPPVAKGQRAVLLLNRLPGAPASAHVFANPPAADDGAAVSFTISGVIAGQYFARVQVDGAESRVVLDSSDPAFGPQVSIP